MAERPAKSKGSARSLLIAKLEILQRENEEQDDRIPAAARFCLEVRARQYAAVRAEIVTIEKRIYAWHRSCEESRRLEGIPGVGPTERSCSGHHLHGGVDPSGHS